MADSLLQTAAALVNDSFAASSYFVTVEENPLYAVPVGEMPALFWWFGAEQVDQYGGAGTGQYVSTALLCSMVVEAASGTEVGEALRAARAEVISLLGAAVSTSGALGAVVSMVEYVGADEPVPLQESGQPIMEQTLEFRLSREEAHLDAFDKG